MRRVHPSVDLLGGGLPVAAMHGALPERLVPRATAASHDYSVVMLGTAGRFRVEQNGEWTLGAGDALLVPAGQAHRMLEARGAAYWGLGFCAAGFVAAGAASLLEPLERVRDGAAAVVRLPTGRQPFIEGLLRELERLTRLRGAASEAEQAVRSSLLTLVLAEVERAAAATPPPAGSGGVVAESLRYIERNCLGPLSLADVAAAVGKSPAYVTTALSRATGRSAGEWIVSGRMAEARRLLLSSSEPVEAIAERVGYADATHFIRMFRRAHGATPAAWRARGSGA
jgi:AraC family transcriptional regulator, transcriptional activator of pobA